MGFLDGFSSISKIFDPVVNVVKAVSTPFTSLLGNSDKYITAVGNKAGDIKK